MDIETADEPFNFNAPSFQLRPRECRHAFSSLLSIPRHSMYAIYADQLGWFGVVWGVNVGIYGIHGVFGICFSRLGEFESTSRSDRPDLGTHLHLDLRRRAGVARLCAEAPVGAVRRLFFVGGGISIGFTLPCSSCSSSSSSPGCPQFCRSSSQSRARLSSPHGIRRRPSRGDPAGQVCLLQGFDEHSSCSVWVWSAEIAGVVTWADGVASYCIPTTIKCRILIILHSKQHLLVACRPES